MLGPVERGDGGRVTTTTGPRPTSTAAPGPVPAPPLAPTVASVAALVGGLLATSGLLLVAFVLALCGIDAGAGSCTDEHRAAWGVLAAAGVVFVGVPALVAALRRDARWLLAPVVEAAVVVAIVALAAVR